MQKHFNKVIKAALWLTMLTAGTAQPALFNIELNELRGKYRSFLIENLKCDRDIADGISKIVFSDMNEILTIPITTIDKDTPLIRIAANQKSVIITLRDLANYVAQKLEPLYGNPKTLRNRMPLKEISQGHINQAKAFVLSLEKRLTPPYFTCGQCLGLGSIFCYLGCVGISHCMSMLEKTQ